MAKGENWYLDISGWRAEINSFEHAKQQAGQGREEDMCELYSCQATLRARLTEKISAHRSQVADLTEQITAAENAKRRLAGQAKERSKALSRR